MLLQVYLLLIEENAKLVLKVKILETKNEHLELVEVKCFNLEQKNEYHENKIKYMTEIEAYLRKKIEEIYVEFKAYRNINV